jgi:hypothetical protein
MFCLLLTVSSSEIRSTTMACMGETGNACKVLVVKHELKETTGKVGG